MAIATDMPDDDSDGESAYDRKKKKMAKRSADITKDGKEIGSCPAVVDPERRARCRDNLIDFARTYFPGRFYLGFCDDHILAAERLDKCSFDGGLFSLAMMRGGGKSVLTEVAVIRNVFYGIKKFVVDIQATDKMALNCLLKIKRELESNELLFEDFPEVCFPIRSLERSSRKAQGQTMAGVATQIEWGADRIILPTVPGSLSSGSVIAVAGLTGAIRGLSLPGPDGRVLRPDMVVIDDSQTRESAGSPTQTASREQIILDDVLGLSGPGVPMSAVMLCTVIYPGDLSDRFLDREKRPEWRGMRTKMMRSMPTNMGLWDEYYEIRRQEMRENRRDFEQSNQFYRDNFEAMNAGAEASWVDRFDPGELTAIQHALNKYYSNPRGFAAEYQNDPENMSFGAGDKVNDAKAIAKRVGVYRRYQVPDEAVKLTAFIDCGGELLWYCVVVWDLHFNGWVIDYGTYPRQSRSLFAKSDPRPSMGGQIGWEHYSEEERVYAGLKKLTDDILGKGYTKEDGTILQINRCLIDSGWQTDTVYKFCRNSPHREIIWPSRGMPRTAGQSWKQRQAERTGDHWRYTMAEESRQYNLQFDADTWKSFAHERLNVPMGGKGVLLLFQGYHEMIGEHCAAEIGYGYEAKGMQWNQWEIKRGLTDNDFWDCIVGNCVAASTLKLSLNPSDRPVEPRQPRQATPNAAPSKPITMEELWKLKQQRKR